MAIQFLHQLPGFVRAHVLQPYSTLIALCGAQSLTPAEVRVKKRALALRQAEAEEKRKSDLWASVQRLLKSPGFQVRDCSASSEASACKAPVPLLDCVMLP